MRRNPGLLLGCKNQCVLSRTKTREDQYDGLRKIIKTKRRRVFEINLIGEILDTLFSLLGKYGRWLNIHRKRWCFIVWIVCCIYWLIIDIHRELYSQALFTIPTIVLHAYGFHKWSKHVH